MEWHGRVFFIAVYLTPALSFISFTLLIMGSTLLKDVFEYADCPATYPLICNNDFRWCCKDSINISKEARPIEANHFWIFATSIPAALMTIVLSCYNRKMSFHPILSDHVNVGLHRISYEISSYKERAMRISLILISLFLLAFSCLAFTIVFAGNNEEGYLSYIYVPLLLASCVAGCSNIFLIQKGWEYQ